MSSQHLNPDRLKPDVEQIATRVGFGEGLLAAGKLNKNVVGICADLTGSTSMNLFAEKFPERFFNVGVAEQNLVTVASGMAAMGKVPFVSSYAAFSPGRNWEQIRTTICLNDTNVKIAGSHAGISVGPDGATHQMLEDIALMRALPNMRVVVPADAIEARKATLALATHKGPSYIRLGREKSPLITTEKSPFELGKAQVLRVESDITIVACGWMVYQSLKAADLLAQDGIEAEVINCAVIKPLDSQTILNSVKKTGAVLSVEEHQVAGGMGSAVAELLGENHPVPMQRMGVQDHFGESGTPEELLEHFGLSAGHIAQAARDLIRRKHGAS
jgi:transketolase